VHPHTILMLAAVALVWLFVVIVVAVTWLQRRGRLGAPDRQLPYARYAPVLAAACSGGAAVVHLGIIGEHAARTTGEAAGSAVALICSIGAGTAHFSSVDASIAGFVPLGILSLGVVGLQGLFAVPRIWQNASLAVAGIAVTAASLGLSIAPRLAQPSTATGATPIATSDALAIVFEIALLIAAGLIVSGRPRRLLDRLQLKAADAYVGTGLGVAAVGIFTVAGLLLGHAAH
jgi:hypothetical protein